LKRYYNRLDKLKLPYKQFHNYWKQISKKF
jgi:hypothetical protein